jgi:predicted phage baseplate assembly protein
VLQSRLTGITAVTNPRAATGGVDAESLESARGRAALEIRGRTRAVTASDFERLTLEASEEVARAVCVAPLGGGPIRVHVLPRIAPADRPLTLDELTPDHGLMRELAAHLDERRLIGTSVELLPVRMKAVSVLVEAQTSPLADVERVKKDITHALYVYLNPLIGGSPAGPGAGWPPMRALNEGELFGVVNGISGVESVKMLRMYETDLRTGNQSAQAEGRLTLEPDELIASGTHIVKASHGGFWK